MYVYIYIYAYIYIYMYNSSTNIRRELGQAEVFAALEAASLSHVRRDLILSMIKRIHMVSICVYIYLYIYIYICVYMYI